MSDQQRCPNCAPGYDCESGVYTPIREGLIVRPGDRLIVTLDDELSAEQGRHFLDRLKGRFGDEVTVTVMSGVHQLALVRPDAEEGDDGQAS